jgi:hypothetical protein
MFIGNSAINLIHFIKPFFFPSLRSFFCMSLRMPHINLSNNLYSPWEILKRAFVGGMICLRKYQRN